MLRTPSIFHSLLQIFTSDNSARVATLGESLFPPYTELGWDQMATPSNEIPADENAKLKYIRGFGRPLWEIGYFILVFYLFI